MDETKLATCKDASTATTWGRRPASWDRGIARNMKTTWGSMVSPDSEICKKYVIVMFIYF